MHPIVRCSFSSTGIKVTSSVPAEGHISCDLEQCKCQGQPRADSADSGASVAGFSTNGLVARSNFRITSILRHRDIVGARAVSLVEIILEQ